MEGLLRGMLPKGWDCKDDNPYGIKCDGITLRSTVGNNSNNNNNNISSSTTDDEITSQRLHPISANESIKISSLNPIINMIKQQQKQQHHYYQHGSSSSSSSSSIINNSNNNVPSVYYFEVFVISGHCAVGFVPDHDNVVTTTTTNMMDSSFTSSTSLSSSVMDDVIIINDENNNNNNNNNNSSSSNSNTITNLIPKVGQLIHHAHAEFPLLQNNHSKNGDTIGCGIIFGGTNNNGNNSTATPSSAALAAGGTTSETTYFFTHNGVRLNVEQYGIDSRVKSLSTALVPTVALSTNVDTVVRTNFGFDSDTPFLWNGDTDGFFIISHFRSSGGGVGSAVTTGGGGSGVVREGGGNMNVVAPRFPPRLSFAQSRATSNESEGSLLTDCDEIMPLPTVLVRGTSVIEYHQQQEQQNSFLRPDPPQRRLSLPTGSAFPFSLAESLNVGTATTTTNNIPSTTTPPQIEQQEDFDLKDVKELATELSRATSKSRTNNQSSITELIAICQSNLSHLNNKIQRVDGEDFGELISVHDLVSDAISDGENWINNRDSVEDSLQRGHLVGEESSNLYETQSQRRSDDVVVVSNNHKDGVDEAIPILSTSPSQKHEISSLQSEELRDIFGLLCHLRGRKEETRIDAAQSLLRLTRRRGKSEELHHIIQSGGMQSFFTLFQSSSDSPVLLKVSALNVAFLVPSYTDEVTHKDVMVMINCLYYLVQSSSSRILLGAVDDLDITPTEVFTACVEAMKFVWANYFAPKFLSSDLNDVDDDCFPRQRVSPKRRSFRDNDDVDYCQLLNSFTSLSVVSVSLDCEDAVGPDKSTYYDFADILQSLCAVECCRGLVMKEGVMSILLKWMRSEDMKLELVAANALRDLTASKHSYTAGWVHSEWLNDGHAIADVVKRLRLPDLEVKRCMAEIISCLSGVPHTRAAIIEAEGIKCLGHVLVNINMTDTVDDRIAIAVGNSLLNLATCYGVYASCERTTFPSKQGCILDGIMKSGAMESLSSMSRLDNCTELRFLYSKLLRVISEAPCSAHPTQQFLCDSGAVTVLGGVLSSDVASLQKYIETALAKTNRSDLLNDSLHNDFSSHHRESISSVQVEHAVKEIREVLRGLCNIFSMEIVPGANSATKAFSNFITSGGVKSLLWLASMTPDSVSTLSMFQIDSSCISDISVDSCRALSLLCPILLLQACASKWAPVVLSSLIQLLKVGSHSISSISTDADVILAAQTGALQGIISLAECDALRTRIIDEFMPQLFKLHEHENGLVSNAARQVCIALGFSAAELGVRWDAYHLGDKFVYARSLLIQSMVRDEIRKWLDDIWTPQLESQTQHGLGGLLSLFQNLCNDDETFDLRNQVRDQFTKVYEAVPAGSNRTESLGRMSSSSKRNFHRTRSFIDAGDAVLDEVSSPRNPIVSISEHALREFLDGDDKPASNELENNFLGSHQYPLSGYEEEKDWIVQHSLSLKAVLPEISLSLLNLPGRVNTVLRVYFPSALIRDEVIPLHVLSPRASFDFRALCMPSQKYCSFRHEGQMVSAQYEEFLLQPERVHCTLGFRNSSFALEFADSLLQTLYLCPAIQGLSFSNDPPEDPTKRGASYHEYEGSELLAKLLRTLPSSISYLTFDDVLSNSAALFLVHCLQSMSSESSLDDEDTVGSGTVGSSKSFVRALAIINSPHIRSSTFSSLIETIQSPPRDGVTSLFQSLRILDLSGNLLGDEASARVLEMVFLPSSSHNIERLDLSRNGIKKGLAVKRTLQECVSSQPKLEVLNMAMNELGFGDVASDIVYSLAGVLSSLTSLDLSSNFLTGEVLDRLGGILIGNSRLQVLNVSDNQFSKSSVESLTSMLYRAIKTSSQLSFLHLNDNSPALTSKQETMLSHVMIENRMRCISSYFEGLSKVSIDDSSTGPLSTLSEITYPKFDQSLVHGRKNMITVLFSAPLVWRDDQNNYYPIEMLDFELEKSLLWQCFTEASRNIDLSYDNATTDRLQAARTKGCGCLHYSGHGHPTHLTFEDGSGGIHWLEVDQLKDLILAGSENGRPPFNFVFVSACHSFLAGQTFVDAGVPHVVCCQQEAQLMDNAAISFTRAFYLALAFGRTVRESFEIGKQAVLNSPTVPNADVEMKKFLLLPEDGKHEVAVLDAEPVPVWPLPQPKGTPAKGPFLRKSSAGSTDLDSPIEYRMPSLPQGFLGRETDMYHVLNLVLSRRLVNVSGFPGIGRSSLTTALCHYIDARKSTMMFEQIYFARSAPRRNGKTSPIFSLCEQIESSRNKKLPTIPTNLDLDETIEIILRSLRETKALLIFERIETLEGADIQDFQFFLGQIFAETKDVHVLISSNKSLGLLQLTGVGEAIYNLGPLDFRSTVKLFSFWCPHLQSSGERKEILDLLAPEPDSLDSEPTPDTEVSTTVMTMLGDGIPARTISAAYSMTIEEFNELKSLV